MGSFIFTIALVLCVASAIAKDESSFDTACASSGNFGANLYEAITNETNENVISSPLSAYFALTMAAFGARENTATQMRAALNIPTNDSVTRVHIQSLLDNLDDTQNVTLEVTNKIFVAKNLDLKSDFKQESKELFRSETDLLDVEQPDMAAQLVNEWVDEKTHHKISKILDSADVKPDLMMVLLNAVYFKGNWANRFNANKTQDRPFHFMKNGVEQEKMVPTMFRNGDYFFGILPDLKAKFVKLPYQNKNLEMLIIVPNKVDGLAEIEQNRKTFNYSYLEKLGGEHKLDLYLPKFKIESKLELQPALEKLGMNDMFTDNANFSGISNQRLKVDKVLQKAFIEVNEEGSEAAAVTEAKIVLMSLPIVYELFVDRPFYFEIIKKCNDKETITLFAGSIKTL